MWSPTVFDAEQGLAGGAAISVQTRSGSNELHGSAFAHHTDQHIKAKPFFLPTGQNQPKLIYNQLGATTGGPIRKNKLFYFLSYEGTLDRETAARFTTVPTAAIKRRYDGIQFADLRSSKRRQPRR